MMERFGIGRVFGLHNEPGRRARRDRDSGRAAAGGGRRLHGSGCAGAAGMRPIRRPASIRCRRRSRIGQALMTIPARRVDPLAEIVVSLTVLRAGEASNVIPEIAELGGTVRTLDEAVRRQAKAAVERDRRGHGGGLRRRGRARLPARLSGAGQRRRPRRPSAPRSRPGWSARRWWWPDRRPEMGAEDFAYMLQARPGAYVFLGTGDGAGLHHPGLRLQRRGDADRRLLLRAAGRGRAAARGPVSFGLAFLAMLAELATGYPDAAVPRRRASGQLDRGG